MNTDAIREAALIVASLDRSSADALLERLPADQARAIRDVMVLVHEDGRHEQKRVIRDFLKSSQPNGTGSVQSDFSAARTPDFVEYSPPPTPCTSSMNELLSHDSQAITIVLRCERTSVVASMLAALPNERAAAVLRLLPTSMRASAIDALNVGIQPNSKAIDLIADQICETRAEHLSDQPVGMQHRDALRAIFDELTPEEQKDMLRDIERENPMLARRLIKGPSVLA